MRFWSAVRVWGFDCCVIDEILFAWPRGAEGKDDNQGKMTLLISCPVVGVNTCLNQLELRLTAGLRSMRDHVDHNVGNLFAIFRVECETRRKPKLGCTPRSARLFT